MVQRASLGLGAPGPPSAPDSSVPHPSHAPTALGPAKSTLAALMLSPCHSQTSQEAFSAARVPVEHIQDRAWIGAPERN